MRCELTLEIEPSDRGDQPASTVSEMASMSATMAILSRELLTITDTLHHHRKLAISRSPAKSKGRGRWQVALGETGSWSSLQPSLDEAITAAERGDYN